MTPGERSGAAIFAAVAVLWLTLVVAAMTGTIDDLIVWVFGAELLRWLATWAAGGVVLVVAFRAVGGPAIFHSHGNRSRRKVLRHERAHRRALRLAGGGGSSLRVWRNDNGTWAGRVRPHSNSRWYRLPVANRLAVYRAGGAAAPDTNCDWDREQAARLLASVPAQDQARVDREADALVRRWGV